MSKNKRFYLGSLLSIGALIGLSAPIALGSLSRLKTSVTTYRLVDHSLQPSIFLSNPSSSNTSFSDHSPPLTYSQPDTGDYRYFIQDHYPAGNFFITNYPSRGKFFIKNYPPHGHFSIAPKLEPLPNKHLQLQTEPPPPLPKDLGTE